MPHTLNNLGVAALLTAAVLYAVLTLGPAAWRRRLIGTCAALFAAAPPALHLRSVATRLAAAAAAGKAACGGCDNCGSSAAATASGVTGVTGATGAAPAGPTGGSEIRVPLSRIGRR